VNSRLGLLAKPFFCFQKNKIIRKNRINRIAKDGDPNLDYPAAKYLILNVHMDS